MVANDTIKDSLCNYNITKYCIVCYIKISLNEKILFLLIKSPYTLCSLMSEFSHLCLSDHVACKYEVSSPNMHKTFKF